jgi:ribosomal protein S18 acetylase RimI-like enzyme
MAVSAFEFRPASDARDWAQARALIEAYAAELAVDLSFQGFAAEVENLASVYRAPGGLWLATARGTPVGCVGLRELDAGRGELKRMYVVPASRGVGLGRALLEVAVAAARAAGWRAIRLDTLPGMEPAQALYAAVGFKLIAPYRANPVPGAAFLELDLTRKPPSPA